MLLSNEIKDMWHQNKLLIICVTLLTTGSIRITLLNNIEQLLLQDFSICNKKVTILQKILQCLTSIGFIRYYIENLRESEIYFFLWNIVIREGYAMLIGICTISTDWFNYKFRIPNMSITHLMDIHMKLHFRVGMRSLLLCDLKSLI